MNGFLQRREWTARFPSFWGTHRWAILAGLLGAAVWAAGFALLAVLWGIFTAVVHRLVKMTVVS